MKNIIAQAIQDATDGKLHTVTHEMSVSVESSKVVEAAIQAWGRELKNIRGAPAWSRIEPLIDDIDDAKGRLTVVTDQDGRGALQFEFGPEQQKSFGELKSLLVALASKVGLPAEAIAQAGSAYDESIDNAQLSEGYEPAMGRLAVASFLDKTAVMNAVVHHERFGELDSKSLVSLVQIKAPIPLEGGPSGDDAIAAQMPRVMSIPDSAKYHSMGQMVQASDAKALGDYIDIAVAEKYWDENKTEACTKLGFVAAGQGSMETMRVLLDKGGADIDFSASQGMTPLAVATANNHPDMVEFLIKRGADKKKTPFDGRSLLMLAASHDAVDSIRALAKLGFDIDETSLEGRTALHHAALGEEDATSTGAVKTLIALGANPTIVDDMGSDGGCLAEEYVDEESDEAYSALGQYRKDWEAGKTGPQTAVSATIGKARSILGF